jgi:uncharacterized protein (TIGR02145 family)
MKTASLFFSLLRRAKSRRDGTVLIVCDSLRAFSLREILLSALALFTCASLHAQVTIGGLENPKTGAILDLNSTAKGGLLLSNVVILDPGKIPYNASAFPGITTDADADVNPGMSGAMVYNTGEGTAVPAGIYVWNGYYWTPDGNCNPVITSSSPSPVSVAAGRSTPLSVTVEACPPFTYQWYTSADGTLNSLTLINGEIEAKYDTPISLAAETTHYYCCRVSSSSGEATSDVFTVNVTVNPASLPRGSGSFTGPTCLDLARGNESTCGTLSGRLNMRTDFLNRTLQDRTGGSYSGVQVYTFIPPGAVSRVRFACEEIRGVSVDRIEYADYSGNNISTACKVTVYYREELDSELLGTTRDTGCKLKLYAIYNSDAEYSTPTNDKMLGLLVSLQDCSCCGAYFNTQWLNIMCHNLGADEGADPFTPSAAIHGAKYKWGSATPSLTQEEDQDPAYNNSVSDWSSRGTAQSTGSVWSDTNNPCPPGWRIPTQAEWSIIGNRTQIGDFKINSVTNFTSGIMVGDALFLPAAGTHNSAGPNNRGASGVYWANEMSGTGAKIVNFQNGSYGTGNTMSINSGVSVRCVAK